MRKLSTFSLAFLLLGYAASAHASVVLGQKTGVGAVQMANQTTPATQTFPGDAGSAVNTIIFEVVVDSNTITATPAISGSETITTLYDSGSTITPHIYVFCAENVSTSSQPVISAYPSDTAEVEITGQEFDSNTSAQPDCSTIDVSASAHVTNSSSVSTSAISTTHANDVLLTFSANGAAAAVTAPASPWSAIVGWADAPTFYDAGGVAGAIVTSTKSNVTATWSWTGNTFAAAWTGAIEIQ